MGYALTLRPDPPWKESQTRPSTWVSPRDGYLDTYYIINGLGSAYQPEGQPGYQLDMLEGAIAYYEATGKDKLLCHDPLRGLHRRRFAWRSCRATATRWRNG